ncbi:MAG: DUF4351 domain-containing protein [Magnetococcales bacterium]|nr:DUF4351 domain-containing protein [Magnetococcales bacterium]
MLATQIEKWSREIERKGYREGYREGEAWMLMRQLQRRFGMLPEWIGERIAQAKPELLEEWGLRILNARSLEEIFWVGTDGDVLR